MNTAAPQQVPCAYELCRRGDPILVRPGHRPRCFHDDACRQAQHRLVLARQQQEKLLVTLREGWEGYPSETQQILAALVHQYGVECARQVVALLAAGRESAQ